MCVMLHKIFGTDGIRGRANQEPMTADTALKVAMAAAQVLKRDHGRHHINRVVIGKDTRLSGYMIEQAMAAGFVACGMDVVLVGPIPTPGIAMLTRSMRADAGVMISASHNPYQDNGIKIFGADGYKLADEIEARIEEVLDNDRCQDGAVAADAIGQASRLDDATGRYIEYLKASLPRGTTFDNLKIVVDCAHGAAYKLAPQLLWELEAEVIPMGVTPNGKNINDACGATAPEALQQRVVDDGADIGLALDGDADRLIVVDETGRVIDGDQLMAGLAVDLQARGQLASDTVVATVMSNLGLERYLHTLGLGLHRTPVGDRHVVESMREGGHNLGGEQSGHIILSDYSTTGDGVLSALQVLHILARHGGPASRAFDHFTPVPQILQSVRYDAAKVAPLEDRTIRAAIANAEERLGDQGRLVVRASGTEPKIRVMAEGDDAAAVQETVEALCAKIGDTAA